MLKKKDRTGKLEIWITTYSGKDQKHKNLITEQDLWGTNRGAFELAETNPIKEQHLWGTNRGTFEFVEIAEIEGLSKAIINTNGGKKAYGDGNAEEGTRTWGLETQSWVKGAIFAGLTKRYYNNNII